MTDIQFKRKVKEYFRTKLSLKDYLFKFCINLEDGFLKDTYAAYFPYKKEKLVVRYYQDGMWMLDKKEKTTAEVMHYGRSLEECCDYLWSS